MHTNLLDAFDEQVQSRADSVALITWENEQPCSRSWRELASLVQTTAAHLDDLFASSPALPKRIGYTSSNTIDDVVLTLAAARVGAINVPISRKASSAHQQACWDRVGGHWIGEESLVAFRGAKGDRSQISCANSLDQRHQRDCEGRHALAPNTRQKRLRQTQGGAAITDRRAAHQPAAGARLLADM